MDCNVFLFNLLDVDIYFCAFHLKMHPCCQSVHICNFLRSKYCGAVLLDLWDSRSEFSLSHMHYPERQKPGNWIGSIITEWGKHLDFSVTNGAITAAKSLKWYLKLPDLYKHGFRKTWKANLKLRNVVK